MPIIRNDCNVHPNAIAPPKATIGSNGAIIIVQLWLRLNYGTVRVKQYPHSRKASANELCQSFCDEKRVY
jgi:hypothetical protein